MRKPNEANGFVDTDKVQQENTVPKEHSAHTEMMPKGATLCSSYGKSKWSLR